MSEYKNGLNSMGNMSVGKDDISHDPVTGRAVFIDDARYDADSAYKAKVDGLIKQGFHKVSEGSGGGSGDFSTAQVTLINGTSSNRCVIIPSTSEADPPFEPVPFIPCYISLLPNGTAEVTAVLYKGNCKVESGGSGDQLNTVPVATTFVVTSGDAELDTGGVLITGNCTITIGSSGGSNA